MLPSVSFLLLCTVAVVWDVFEGRKLFPLPYPQSCGGGLEGGGRKQNKNMDRKKRKEGGSGHAHGRLLRQFHQLIMQYKAAEVVVVVYLRKEASSQLELIE